MMQKILRIGTVLLLVFLKPVSVHAAGQDPGQAAQFFSSIQDMPLMPGLREMTDQMLVFDKPEGRIVESLALVQSATPGEVQAYYEKVLPQFGWQRIAENSFVRGGEHLQIGFERFDGQQFMRLMLTPREGAAETPNP
jgi:hypothetical protein